ncbi:MAG: hypothetical protein ACM3U2_19550 [Deltaproteobacteria bacterium]
MSDLEKIASEVASRVSKMKQLVARAKGLASDEVGTRRQNGLRMAGVQVRKQCDVVVGYLENRIGKHPALRQALDDLANEETNLEVAMHSAEAQARLQAAQTRAGQPALPRPPPTGLPGLPPGGTPPGLGNLPSSPQAMRDNFLKRHGPDGVLTVKAMKYPGDKQTELSQQLREITGADEIFALTETDITNVYLAFAGDVDEVAGRIDFCKVAAIDAKARTITIEPRGPASGAKK